MPTSKLADFVAGRAAVLTELLSSGSSSNKSKKSTKKQKKQPPSDPPPVPEKPSQWVIDCVLEGRPLPQ